MSDKCDSKEEFIDKMVEYGNELLQEQVTCVVCKYTDKKLRDHLKESSDYKSEQWPEKLVETLKLIGEYLPKDAKLGEISLCIWCRHHVYDTLKQNDLALNKMYETLIKVREIASKLDEALR